LEPLSCRSGKLMVQVTQQEPGGGKCKSLKRSGGPYWTIFATFSCRHRQKCSVSCNSCGRRSVDSFHRLTQAAKPATGLEFMVHGSIVGGKHF
jgi:hypothetical protein